MLLERVSSETLRKRLRRNDTLARLQPLEVVTTASRKCALGFFGKLQLLREFTLLVSVETFNK